MKRRTCIQTGSAAAAVGMAAVNQTYCAPQEKQTLVAVKDGEPGEMLIRAIEELGGMQQFVKKGDQVVLKPNIGWNKPPEMAANTNPEVVGALTKLCVEAGAKEVLVLDHTCGQWTRCYEASGIEAAAKENGGKVVPANNESYYRKVELPDGKVLKETLIHEKIMDCDVWFNIPVLKHHGGAKLSMSMKNLMGICWDRKYFHKNGLQQCIADLNTWEKKPALHIVDAYRSMTQNGPQGKGEEDVVLSKALFACADPVAVDTACAKFFAQYNKRIKLQDVAHIEYAEDLDVGSMNLSRVNIKRIKI